jgi:hypothetical protein
MKRRAGWKVWLISTVIGAVLACGACEAVWERVPLGSPVRPTTAYASVYRKVLAGLPDPEETTYTALLEFPVFRKLAGPPSCQEGEVVAFVLARSGEILPELGSGSFYARVWVRRNADGKPEPATLTIRWGGHSATRATLSPRALPDATSVPERGVYCNRWVAKPLWQLRDDLAASTPVRTLAQPPLKHGFPILLSDCLVVGWSSASMDEVLSIARVQ